MEISRKNNMLIARDALTEFFHPLIKFGQLVKYISDSKYRNDELFKTLSRIESRVNEAEQFQLEILRTSQELNNVLNTTQRNLLNHLKDEFTKSQELIREEITTSSSKLNLHPNSFLSPISSIVNQDKYLEMKELVDGKELTRSAAEIGLANIEYVIKRVSNNAKKIPHLFGVNKGGAFLANYIAHRMGLHEKLLVKCDYRPDFDNFYVEKRNIDGPIVILDDVTRTGTTLRRVKEHLLEKHPESNFITIVLVMSCKDKQKCDEAHKVVDYAPWMTTQPNVTLPWSRSSNDSIESSSYFDDKEMDQIIGRLNFSDPS